ncbi:MAG TPA: transporter [Tepidisphaeraceae bacterium]|nr:transporter [Tepidisphaeraceae bacterium]
MFLMFAVSSARAGRPLIIDDAEPLDLHHFQFEAGIALLKDADCDHFDFPLTLSYGILPGVQACIGFGGQFEDRHGDDDQSSFVQSCSDLTLGIKWKILEQDKAFFDQAILAGVKIPTASRHNDMGSGKVDFDLTYVATRQLTEKTSILFNVGYTWMGDRQESDILHYGPALTYQLTDTLQPVLELVFQTPIDGGPTAAGIDGGIRWQFSDSLMFDAAIGTKVQGDWPELTATMGFTFTR